MANSHDSSMGINISHPDKAGSKNLKVNFKAVAANHACRSAANVPNRIIGDYQLVDDAGNKISALDAGSQVVLEIVFTQADFERANKDASKMNLFYWNGSSWVQFTNKEHGFKVVIGDSKYTGFVGYYHVDNNVPIDPPTGATP